MIKRFFSTLRRCILFATVGCLALIAVALLVKLVRPFFPTENIREIEITAKLRYQNRIYKLGGTAQCVRQYLSFGSPWFGGPGGYSDFRMYPAAFDVELSSGGAIILRGTTKICGHPSNGGADYESVPVFEVTDNASEPSTFIAFVSGKVRDVSVSGFSVLEFNAEILDDKISVWNNQRFRKELRAQTEPQVAQIVRDIDVSRYSHPDPLIAQLHDDHKFDDIDQCTDDKTYVRVKAKGGYGGNLERRFKGGIVLEHRDNQPYHIYSENLYDYARFVPLIPSEDGLVPDYANSGTVRLSLARPRNDSPKNILFPDGSTLEAEDRAFYRKCQTGEIFETIVH